MELSLLASAALFGLAGGWHCVAMCGGFAAAAAGRDVLREPGMKPLHPARSLLRGQWIYHGGRIATYALLGAAFGSAGAAALGAVSLLPVQKAIYIAANVFLLVLAASLLTKGEAGAVFRRIGARAFSAALPRLQPLLRRPGLAGRLALGAMWGLTPCALVYGALPLALFAGGAWQGAATMSVFGLATLPSLLTAGALFSRLSRSLRGRPLRLAIAALLTVFALAGIYRALWVPEALAQGPFCFLP
jgi:sulfite exporter TauE/SafE